MPLTKGGERRRRRKTSQLRIIFLYLPQTLSIIKRCLLPGGRRYKEHTLNMLMLNIHLSETERNTTERNKKSVSKKNMHNTHAINNLHFYTLEYFNRSTSTKFTSIERIASE